VDDAVLLVDGEANILNALARLFLDRRHDFGGMHGMTRESFAGRLVRRAG
jgi:hypothetical protein